MNKTPSSLGSHARGIGCLTLFALPFALGGAVALYFALYPVYQSWAASSWKEVPAYILEAQVETSTGSKGSVSYRLGGKFKYEVDGGEYESDRMTFYSAYDNIDSYHHDRYRELSPFIGADRPFRAYVNPDDPNDSVIFADFRWSSLGALALFGLIFSAVGWGLILGSMFGSRGGQSRSELREKHPGEPWMHDPEWAKRQIQCNSKLGVIIFGILAFIWNGISAFMPMMVWKEFQKANPNYWSLLALLFPLIGLALIYGFGVMVVRWRRFGNSMLQLNDIPFRVGGELSATLVASRLLLDVAKELNVKLVCQRVETRGSGKNRTTHTSVVAETAKDIPINIGMGRSDKAHVPIKITVPAAGIPTNDDANPRFHWDLTCSAQIPGADYSATFKVPVF